MKRLNEAVYLLMLYYSQSSEYSKSNEIVMKTQSNIKFVKLFMIINNEKMLIFMKFSS